MARGSSPPCSCPTPPAGRWPRYADRGRRPAAPPAGRNLHVTVHFLGRVDAADAAPLEGALGAAVAPLPAFALRVNGVAPGPRRRPRMLWATIDRDPRFDEPPRGRTPPRRSHRQARPPRTARPHITLVRHEARRRPARRS